MAGEATSSGGATDGYKSHKEKCCVLVSSNVLLLEWTWSVEQWLVADVPRACLPSVQLNRLKKLIPLDR